MVRTAILRKTASPVTTIDESFEAYLIYLASEYSEAAAKKAKPALDALRHTLDRDQNSESATDSFCKQSKPAAIIRRLDRFLRYRVMREMVCTWEQQQFIFFVVYDYCEWLHTNGLFQDRDFELFESLRMKHFTMWEQADAVSHTIAFSFDEKKPAGRSTQVIEFTRHDVAKIEDNKIWLEI